MIVLPCPNCGPRSVSEFRYGGEVQARPAPEQSDRESWAAYLYLRRNPAGPLREWWFHRRGCGRWFLAHRHTQSHQVSTTSYWTAR